MSDSIDFTAQEGGETFVSPLTNTIKLASGPCDGASVVVDPERVPKFIFAKDHPMHAYRFDAETGCYVHVSGIVVVKPD